MCIDTMSKKTTTAARVLTTSAAVVVLGGCAMKGDVRDLQAEIRALALRQDSLLTELRAQTLSTQDTLRTQSNQLFDFRGDINQSIREIGQSLQRLEALAGENQRSLAQVRSQVAEFQRSGMARPTQNPLVDLPPGPGGSEQLVPGGAGNPDEAYQTAMNQYTRSSYNAATMAFREFIEDHPNDDRVPQAHYNIADMLDQQERPEDALEAFQTIPSLFPASPVVPNAMFRSAKLTHELGDSDQAKLILDRILNTYPDHPVASLARVLLEEIG